MSRKPAARKRSARGTFPSALVFPGGAVDREDARGASGDAALRVAALREAHPSGLDGRRWLENPRIHLLALLGAGFEL